MHNTLITFIGAGNLTRALIAGLIHNHYDPKNICAADPDLEKLQALQRQYGVQITQNNLQAIEKAQVVVLAVKPLHLKALCREIGPLILQQRPPVISVAAGVTLPLLKEWLNSYTTIIRAMPNTPAMVGAGATGLYADASVEARQKDLAEMIFRSVGITVWIEQENLLDLICAVSACGPGYIFLMMESIDEAARQKGLAPALSRLLTAQTFLGAARLALESEYPLDELRKQVTSQKGATEKAVQVLEEGNIRRLLDEALEAALARCAEMTKELSE